MPNTTAECPAQSPYDVYINMMQEVGVYVCAVSGKTPMSFRSAKDATVVSALYTVQFIL
jgi:hypothetical protein